ncbi:MAG: N-6 DNA methylase [Gracilibacteraceae bacterium]|nr:N-6 DNA methylase [Gracilibacteraceae bacterium]
MDKKEAAEFLGVTPESVTHWVKLGYLQATAEASQVIDTKSVELLKNRLVDGSVPKLRARANKSRAEGFFIPYVLPDNKAAQRNLVRLAAFIQNRCLPRMAALFALVLNEVMRSDDDGMAVRELKPPLGMPLALWQNVLRGEGEGDGGGHPRAPKYGEALGLELMGLRGRLANSGDWPEDSGNVEAPEWRELLFWDLPRMPDILGVVYQILTQERVKVGQGAYFTPQSVAEAMATDHWQEGRLVLDPCCGTGKFLLAFAAQGAEPGDLWGMDVDPVAVLLARINLLLFYRRPFEPRIFCGDSLDVDGWEEPLRGLLGRFDVVATNPPWGTRERGSRVGIRGYNSGIAPRGMLSYNSGIAPRGILSYNSGKVFGEERFALFLALGLECLRPGGCLSFLLPEAFLMVKRHEDIRRFLLENSVLKRIVCLGNIFYKVMSKAVRVDAEKIGTLRSVREAREESREACGGGDEGKEGNGKEGNSKEGNGKEDHGKEGNGKEGNGDGCVDPARFGRNEGAVFDVWTSPEDRLILDKIESGPLRTLEGHAQWVLGVVTGDNGRFLSGTEGEGADGVLCGGDVDPFALREPSRFLVFRPENLQQTAPERLYRSPKLVYRFIAARPVAAFDAVGRLTLNSANSVIINLEDYPVRAVEALWNTRLYAYVFFHRFHGVKMLRAHLERLPLPDWPSTMLSTLAELAAELGSPDLSGPRRTALKAELDYEVMRGFGLNAREQARVCACVD